MDFLKKTFLTAILSALLPFSGIGQQVRLAFYNAENVFDTLPCPGKDDTEFTPSGESAWNTQRYRTKITHTAQVIADLRPAVLGLAEIENAAVLADLTAAIRVQKGGKYSFIHLESGDERGIDPALLYLPSVFTPTARPQMLRSPLNERGILYVKGVLNATGDTLHVFVNHWTSRYMGQKATEAARIDMARLLAVTADSVLTADKKALIVAFGDLNDTPDEKSVQRLLALPPYLRGHNTTDTRTYHYKGEWLSFDQIFTNFMPRDIHTQVFTRDYMLQKDGTPLRTFSGPVYKGGYSDHLPVYLDVVFRDDQAVNNISTNTH